ncbi:MAG: hypothetical protein K2I43_04035 [Alistipes sp.]|nr:hypothetical protein [Alistipes sp.]
MKCEFFRENIWAMFDDEASDAALRAEMEAHTAECAECARFHRQTAAAVEAVTPRCEATAPESLTRRIEKTVRVSHKGALLRSIGAVVSIAAVVAIVVNVALSASPVRAAGKCFGTAAALFENSKTISMLLELRTEPTENMEYIDPSADFVECRLDAVCGADAMVWRFDKGGRVAVSDGRIMTQWLPEQKRGWTGFLCDASIDAVMLANPRMLMVAEREYAATHKGVRYDMTNDGTTVRVTVDAPAQGDYSQSDYMLNTSIAESDNRRVYCFDAQSGRLLSAVVSVRTASGEVEVLRVKSIAYDEPLDAAEVAAVPGDIELQNMLTLDYGLRLAGITARQAAEKIVRAFEKWDAELLDEALVYYGPVMAKVREMYGGSVAVAFGEPFRSGEYPGEFVPVRLVLAGGGICEMNLALRNDNPAGTWIVDGGI